MAHLSIARIARIARCLLRPEAALVIATTLAGACGGESRNDASGGGSGGTANTGGAPSSGGTPGKRPPGECDKPTPVVVGGSDTGLVGCDGKFLHRKAAGKCPSRVPRPGVVAGDKTTECETDLDCLAKPYGWCGRPVGDHFAVVACQYGCETDADCGADQLCACHESAPAGVCVPASCKIDDDCPGAALCTARLVSSCGGDPQNSLAMAFGCQSAEDECSASDECDQTAHTLCVKGACIPGAGACGAGR